MIYQPGRVASNHTQWPLWLQKYILSGETRDVPWQVYLEIMHDNEIALKALKDERSISYFRAYMDRFLRNPK